MLKGHVPEISPCSESMFECKKCPPRDIFLWGPLQHSPLLKAWLCWITIQKGCISLRLSNRGPVLPSISVSSSVKRKMVSKNRRGPRAQIQISGQAMSSEAVVPPERKAGDWRNQLQADSRQRILNKIIETLKKHLPFSGEDGLQELKKIAETFEEKIYATSRSQSDYLRKISLKMLTMETKSQNPMANPLQLNTASNRENPRNPEYLRPFRAIMKVSSEVVVPSAGDWRNQLHVETRQRIINKIMETLKRHLPFSSEEGLQELKKIAVRFEEKIYTAATSQSEYLRKISLTMLTMETRSQTPMANPLQLNTASNSENPRNPGLDVV